LVAFASSLDQIGPIARTVEDAALLLQAIWGHDPADATSYRADPPSLAGDIDAGVDGLRIGVVTELSQEGIEPEVAASFRATLEGLASAGAIIENVSLPTAAEAVSIYYLIAPAEASSNLARFDGVRYGLRVDGATAEQMMGRTRAEGFGPEVIRRVLLGTYALSAGYYDAFYGQAQRARTLLIDEFAAAYRSFDVLVSPTSPTTAFPLGARTQDPLTMYMSDVCTIPSNLAGHPAISVPSGSDSAGLPIGFQVMAPALGEAVLYRVARAVEGIGGPMRRPVVDAVAS
jgi:aspartyl-tRNA(Asn)/glutamyl-tRNA(Gln) amidotransferase subunit A